VWLAIAEKSRVEAENEAVKRYLKYNENKVANNMAETTGRSQKECHFSA